MVFANGKKYEGDWVEGIQQGVGTIDELDGYTYTGKFNNGLKNGYFCKTKKQIIRELRILSRRNQAGTSITQRN